MTPVIVFLSLMWENCIESPAIGTIAGIWLGETTKFEAKIES